MSRHRQFFGIVFVLFFVILGFSSHARAVSVSDLNELDPSLIKVDRAIGATGWHLSFPAAPAGCIYKGCSYNGTPQNLSFDDLYSGDYQDDNKDSGFHPTVSGTYLGVAVIEDFNGSSLSQATDYNTFVKDATITLGYHPDDPSGSKVFTGGFATDIPFKREGTLFIWNGSWDEVDYDTDSCPNIKSLANHACGKAKRLRKASGYSIGDLLLAVKNGAGSLATDYQYDSVGNTIVEKTGKKKVFTSCSATNFSNPGCDPGDQEWTIVIPSGTDLKTCSTDVDAKLKHSGNEMDVKVACANSTSNTPPVGSSGSSGGKKTCSENFGGPFGWVICHALQAMDSLANWLSSQIGGFLYIKTDDLFTPELKKSWQTISRLATLVIVIVALIMIFSEAMGSGIMDNYSVKKILPRLVVAGIGVQLSWFGCKIAVDVFNALGVGIEGLLTAPFGESLKNGVAGLVSTNGVFSGWSFVTGAVVVGGAIFLMLTSVGTIVMALVVGFATLVFRRIILVLGVAFAPIAMAAWVLPGTQKISKYWYESFSKALAMYPLIMGLIASGKIVGAILGANQDQFIYKLAGAIAWFLPYALIPATFKMGGQALGKLTGVVNDKSKGPMDRFSNWNKNRRKAIKEQGAANRGIRRSTDDYSRFQRLRGLRMRDNLRDGRVMGLTRNARDAAAINRDKTRAEGFNNAIELQKARAGLAGEKASVEYGLNGANVLANIKAEQIKLQAQGEIQINHPDLEIQKANLEAEKQHVQADTFNADIEHSKIEAQEIEAKSQNKVAADYLDKTGRHLAVDQAEVQATKLAMQGRQYDRAKAEEEVKMQEKKIATDREMLALKSTGDYANKDVLRDIVADTNRTDAQRQAALNRLFEMGADSHIDDLDKRFKDGGSLGRDSFRTSYDSTRNGEVFGAFKDKAPDLAKGGAAAVFQVSKLSSPEAAAKWSAGTWQRAYEHANSLGGAEGEELRKHLAKLGSSIYGDQQLDRQLDNEQRQAIFAAGGRPPAATPTAPTPTTPPTSPDDLTGTGGEGI